MNGLWYCPAYCTVANQIREFRIDRIKEIIEEKPYPKGKFPVPASIQEYLERLEIGNDYHIKIKLTDIGVKRCETEFLLARGLKTFPTGGGIIDMKIRHATLDWVANYFLSFGNNATVLEPPELVELIKQKIYELHQHPGRKCMRKPPLETRKRWNAMRITLPQGGKHTTGKNRKSPPRKQSKAHSRPL